MNIAIIEKIGYNYYKLSDNSQKTIAYEISSVLYKEVNFLKCYRYWYNTETEEIYDCGYPSDDLYKPELVIDDEGEEWTEGITLEELKEIYYKTLRTMCSEILLETDYITIRKLEEDWLGIAHELTDQEYTASCQARQLERERYYEVKDEIEAIDNIPDLKNYVITL